MRENGEPTLLPTGLRDLLPPEAAFEADVTERLLACFAAQGYERVKPPLVEFEECLLNSVSAGLAGQTFRLMDPASHRMMAVRSDLTPQVARIASSRLARSPRPLRLSYAGEILRIYGSELRPERQFGQVGLELIGVVGAEADAEIILSAVEALEAVGIGEELSVDLSAPTLVSSLISETELEPFDADRLRQALDRKEIAAVSEIAGEAASSFAGLLNSTGSSNEVLERLYRLPFSGAAASARDALGSVAQIVRDSSPHLPLTIDPVEWRGFEYHTGTSFTLFASGARAEIGRGGRYPVAPGQDGVMEEATGCTLYMDTLMVTMPRPEQARRVYLPYGTPRDVGNSLRGEDWVTICGLLPTVDVENEALRLKCSHILRDGIPEVLVKE